MDNLFQILIFLFVIYTIFNSVMGKKKPQKTNRDIPGETTGEFESTPSSQTQYSSGDVLQDLFGLKIPKTGDEYGTYPPSGYSAESSPPDDRENIENREMPDIDYDNLPSLEVTRALETEADNQTVYEVQRTSNLRMADLKQKLRTKQTLKELFLISEILNKPKALRK